MRADLRLIFVMMILVTGWTAFARADVKADIAISPGPVQLRMVGIGNGWVTLEARVSFAAEARDVELTLQDVRGGVAVSRKVFGDGPTRQTWLALPLVNGGELRDQWWPLDAVVLADGKEVRRTQVNILLEGSAAQQVLRVAVPPGAKNEAAGMHWSEISSLPVAFIEMPEEEMLTGPALLFAACDVIMLPAGRQDRFTRERALDLMAVGVRIAVRGEQTPGGELSSLVWERWDASATISSSARPAIGTEWWTAPGWICPSAALSRPNVIEPGLSNLVEWQQGVKANTHVVAALMLAAPAAIVALLLVRGLFKRARVVFLAATLAMGGLTAGIITYIRGAAAELHHEVRWQTTTAPFSAGHAAAGSLILTETLAASDSLFATDFTETSGRARVLFPVATSAREYWGLRNLRLVLGGGDPDTSDRLEGAIPARGIVRYEMRSANAEGLLPKFPETQAERLRFAEMAKVELARGWWVAGGYVFPGNGNLLNAGSGELLTKWAAAQPATLRQAIRAWYEVRFEGAHRYFLWPGDGDSGMKIVDFGPRPGE